MSTSVDAAGGHMRRSAPLFRARIMDYVVVHKYTYSTKGGQKSCRRRRLLCPLAARSLFVPGPIGRSAAAGSGRYGLGLPETEKLDSSGTARLCKDFLDAVEVSLQIFVAGTPRVGLRNPIVKLGQRLRRCRGHVAA